MEGNEEFISSDSAPTRSLGGQQQFIGMRVVSSDDRHRVNHIRILQFAVHPPRAMPRAWPCGSNRSAVVLLHQMLTLPCNTQRAIFGLDAFPFGLWGMAVCLPGRSVRPTWRLGWRRGGSVETTCGDMSPTMTWLIPRHVAVSGLLAYRLEACSHSSWYCLAALA